MGCSQVGSQWCADYVKSGSVHEIRSHKILLSWSHVYRIRCINQRYRFPPLYFLLNVADQLRNYKYLSLKALRRDMIHIKIKILRIYLRSNQYFELHLEFMQIFPCILYTLLPRNFVKVCNKVRDNGIQYQGMTLRRKIQSSRRLLPRGYERQSGTWIIRGMAALFGGW